MIKGQKKTNQPINKIMKNVESKNHFVIIQGNAASDGWIAWR